MLRTLLAAFAAVAVLAAQPVFACEDCKNCPMHKAAATDDKKAEKSDKMACACSASAKDCKCAEKCACPGHDHKGHDHHAEKKADEKKS